MTFFDGVTYDCKNQKKRRKAAHSKTPSRQHGTGAGEQTAFFGVSLINKRGKVLQNTIDYF